MLENEPGRHDIVQDRVDGGREVVEAAGDEVHLLVDGAEVGRIFGVHVEQPLGVEWSPAHEEADHHGH